MWTGSRSLLFLIPRTRPVMSVCTPGAEIRQIQRISPLMISSSLRWNRTFSNNTKTADLSPPFLLRVILLASCDDQLRCIRTRFTAGQTDGSGVVPSQRQAERSIAGDKGSDIHSDPGAAPESSDRADLDSQRRSGVKGNTPFCPACVRHCIYLASGRAAAVGIELELGAGNGSTYSLDVEGQVAVHNRAGIKADLL